MIFKTCCVKVVEGLAEHFYIDRMFLLMAVLCLYRFIFQSLA